MRVFRLVVAAIGFVGGFNAGLYVLNTLDWSGWQNATLAVFLGMILSNVISTYLEDDINGTD